jgi:hypothetical protein
MAGDDEVPVRAGFVPDGFQRPAGEAAAGRLAADKGACRWQHGVRGARAAPLANQVGAAAMEFTSVAFPLANLVICGSSSVALVLPRSAS